MCVSVTQTIHQPIKLDGWEVNLIFCLNAERLNAPVSGIALVMPFIGWDKELLFRSFYAFYVTLTQTKVMFLSSSVCDNNKERISCVLASVLNHSGNLRGSSNIITFYEFSCKATQWDSIFITVDFFRACENSSGAFKLSFTMNDVLNKEVYFLTTISS